MDAMKNLVGPALGLLFGLVFGLVFSLVFGAAAQAADAPHYMIDPSHSFVYAEVDHFGASTLRIRFGPLKGDVEFDREAHRGELGLRVDPASVSTGFAAFDARLREADLLDTEKSPEAYFVASHFSFEGDTLRSINGEFTLRGVSQALQLNATRFSCYTSPLFKREVCGGDFEGELKRSDFGATFGLPFIGDRVRLRIQVEAVLQGP